MLAYTERKGKWFGKGRFLGVHNPFDSDLNKAKDPFIKMKTLIKLSHSFDLEVKTEVIKNLTQRAREIKPDEFRQLHGMVQHAVLLKSAMMHLNHLFELAYTMEYDRGTFMIVKTLANTAQSLQIQIYDKNITIAPYHIAHMLAGSLKPVKIKPNDKGDYETVDANIKAYDEWASSGVDPAHTTPPPELHGHSYVTTYSRNPGSHYTVEQLDWLVSKVKEYPAGVQREIMHELYNIDIELGQHVNEAL